MEERAQPLQQLSWEPWWPVLTSVLRPPVFESEAGQCSFTAGRYRPARRGFPGGPLSASAHLLIGSQVLCSAVRLLTEAQPEWQNVERRLLRGSSLGSARGGLCELEQRFSVLRHAAPCCSGKSLMPYERNWMNRHLSSRKICTCAHVNYMYEGCPQSVQPSNRKMRHLWLDFLQTGLVGCIEIGDTKVTRGETCFGLQIPSDVRHRRQVGDRVLPCTGKRWGRDSCRCRRDLC